MDTNFIKLGKRAKLFLTVKALIFGICLGISCASAYVIVLKLLSVAYSVTLAVLIGALSAALAASLVILLKWPTEVRLAKSIDKSLMLGEKAQTMVEFIGEDGEMIGVQRADTERIIAEAPKKSFGIKRAYLHIISPLISAAMITAALVLPVKAESSQPPIGSQQPATDTWSLTDMQRTRVLLLIQTVKESSLDQSGKLAVAASLENMLSKLEKIQTRSEMKRTVIACMAEIDAVVDGINTYTEITSAIGESQSSSVKKFLSALSVSLVPINQTAFDELGDQLSSSSAKDELASLSVELEFLCNSVADGKEDDAFYKAIISFANELASLSEKLESGSAENLSEDLDELLYSAEDSLGSALALQYNNRKVSNDAISELMDIFGIKYNELPDSVKNNEPGVSSQISGGVEDEDDPPQGSSGGKGDGEVIYGSDDVIFDKDSGKLVVYGEVIDAYNIKKTEMLNDSALPEEIKNAIEKYFDDLYYKQENE